jgi:DNA-binding transcriptional MerR regulator
MERPLTIGQLAEAVPLSAKTIRYYERVGVLPTPSRNAAGYRQYTRHDLHRLQFLSRARALGLPLADLKTLTAGLDTGPGATLRPQLETAITGQLRGVRRRIGELQLLERELAQLLDRLQTRAADRHAGGCRCLDNASAG